MAAGTSKLPLGAVCAAANARVNAGAERANLKMSFCSYPITPASALLHVLANMKQFDVSTFQAEDEIAAVCAAIGASYGGAIGVTSSSGPGIALKTEAIGLAINAELPFTAPPPALGDLAA